MGDIIDVDDLLVFSDQELSSEHKMLQYALNAIAAICSTHEETRRKLMEQDSHIAIVRLLKHAEPKIRSSACQALVSLARAEKVPKNALLAEGVISLLHKLLYDAYLDVQVNAASVLCNLTLDFQKQIADTVDCVRRLAELTQSKHASLRYKAVFALKNLLFSPTPDVKKTVLTHLSYSRIMELLEDEEPSIQEQAIITLRNLMHNKPEGLQEVCE
jgi:hypothetical protein